MARIEKTVFISYRRTDVYTALAVYENLKNQGYDVFFDYRSISSGDFEQIITSNIRARAHFLLILTPTALDRCNEPGDWLRREIEIAIDEKRNIVPLFFKGFRFGTPSVSEKLTGKLKNISRYNGLNVHEDYFDEAMYRLRTEYLNKPLDTVLHPVSTDVRKVVREEQEAADKALKQREAIKEPVKQIEEKPVEKNELSEPIPSKPEKKKVSSPTPMKAIPWRKIGGIAGILTVLALCIWGGISLWNNLPGYATKAAVIIQPTATVPVEPENTNILSQTETSVPSTPTSEFSIGSTMTGKDGMTMLYVPAGEFIMGSNTGEDNARPMHAVYLDAFWIDQTEVTNIMFANFVEAAGYTTDAEKAGESQVYQDDDWKQVEGADWLHPLGPSSGISDIWEHPVVHISWNDAQAYCAWVDRRLPTEAEWEKAASWDDKNHRKSVYPWGNSFEGNRSNFCDENCPTLLANRYLGNDGYEFSAPVGTYPIGASPYGALDMAGNVWEWLNDWYDAYPGNAESDSAFGTTYRVRRGGAWSYSFDSIRTVNRDKQRPTISLDDMGFRCAMDASP